MGNRVYKRVVTPLSGGGADTVDTWYVRDPQGNPMAIYEQRYEQDSLKTYLIELPIYGAERIGGCRAPVLLSSVCVAGCGGTGNEGDPKGFDRSVLLTEVLYDSPATPDDTLPGTERHDGEYVLLTNVAGQLVDLSNVRVRNLVNGTSYAFAPGEAMAAEEKILLVNSESGCGLPLYWTAADSGLRVLCNSVLRLEDGGGELVVEQLEVGGSNVVELDRMPYGPFHGLVAENDYLVDSIVDSLSLRSSLTSVQRVAYSPGNSGLVSGVTVGLVNPGSKPVPSPFVWSGGFDLMRGLKAYELKNHLGNVLAVVSDLKLGLQEDFNTVPNDVDWYEADRILLQDYYPFGMLLPERRYVGSGYRYGFNGKENDNEWKGAGNSQDYGLRINDTRLGRFLSLDPIASQYPFYAPYHFAGNNPVYAIDLDGLEPVGHPERWKRLKIYTNSNLTNYLDIIEDIKGDKFAVIKRGIANTKFSEYFYMDHEKFELAKTTATGKNFIKFRDEGAIAAQTREAWGTFTTVMATGYEVVFTFATGMELAPLLIQGAKWLVKKAPQFAGRILEKARTATSGLVRKASGGADDAAVVASQTIDDASRAIPFDRTQVGTTINNATKQAEHIEGSKAYLNRVKVTGNHPSVLTEDASALLDDFHAGKGTVVSNNPAHKSVIVKFDKPIGNVVDPSTGKAITKGTRYGAIKYGKNTHITPVNWSEK